MNKQQTDQISKLLSYILRHNPQDIKLQLNPQGWVEVDVLLERLQQYKGLQLSKQDLTEVVQTNNKQRFAFSEDGAWIRANQGHTVEVFLDLPDVEPPEFLFHGTATRFLPAIMKQGLKPMTRHDVHLSFNEATAWKVGQRHGSPVILQVKSRQMAEQGYKFKCTANNVWLTQAVPVEFIEVLLRK